jgi:hypothetical protein
MSKHCILKQIVWIFLKHKRPFRETYGSDFNSESHFQNNARLYYPKVAPDTPFGKYVTVIKA